MKTYISVFVMVAGTLLAFAADREAIPCLGNLREALSKPANQQDDFLKKMAEKLAKSQVPTADQASSLALGAFLKKTDARESVCVSGLYIIGRDVADFASAGDLVWEIHITRPFHAVSGVVWVSTTTKKARVLFPIDP